MSQKPGPPARTNFELLGNCPEGGHMAPPQWWIGLRYIFRRQRGQFREWFNTLTLFNKSNNLRSEIQWFFFFSLSSWELFESFHLTIHINIKWIRIWKIRSYSRVEMKSFLGESKCKYNLYLNIFWRILYLFDRFNIGYWGILFPKQLTTTSYDILRQFTTLIRHLWQLWRETDI